MVSALESICDDAAKRKCYLLKSYNMVAREEAKWGNPDAETQTSDALSH